MTLQTSGPISLLDLANEFGGSAPHSLSEYYRGGSLVPATRSTTIYEPGPGTSNWEYDLNAAYGWAFLDQQGIGFGFAYWEVYAYWNSTTEFFNQNGTGSFVSAVTTGGWTYRRGSLQLTDTATDPDGNPPGLTDLRVYEIRRERTITVNINTGVPTGGAISLGDFYGATNS